MLRTRALSLALVVPLGLALAAAPTAGAEPVRPAAGTVAPELVIDSDFPDPDVIEVDGTFHAYSTSSSNKGVVPHATAPAADGPWTVQSDVFAPSGEWPDWIRTTHGFWAPDVSQRPDGSFLMYFTARNDDNDRMCLGAATADGPAGPFVPQPEPLVCNADEGGNIDASSFVDDDGTPYMLYKNDGNAIGEPAILWLQRTDPSGLQLLGERTELLRNDRPADQGVIEAPTLIRRDSQYVLFFSAGVYTQGTYYTGYATSPTLTGPFTRAERPLLTTETVDGTVSGPGGQDVLEDTIVFHGWLPEGGRGMYTAALGWDDDLPVVQGSRLRTEAEDATLEGASVRAAAGASGDAVVTGLDRAGSGAELSVFAPVAGGYTLHLGYANGAGPAVWGLTVGGSSTRAVSLPARGADRWREASVDVVLEPGQNTIRLEHRSGSAELDYVDVA